MMQFIWGLLNISVFILFIVVCFKSVRIVRERLGLFTALFFVFGLLAFIARPGHENSKTKIFDSKGQDAVGQTFHNHADHADLILENNVMSKIHLVVLHGEDENGKDLYTLFSDRTGFVSGTDWAAQNIIVNRLEAENSFVYDVSGTLEWKLLGVTIYTEPKRFKGKSRYQN